MSIRICCFSSVKSWNFLFSRKNLEKFTSKNNNKEEDEKKELNINAENGRKRYKLKTDKNLEIKAPFP